MTHQLSDELERNDREIAVCSCGVRHEPFKRKLVIRQFSAVYTVMKFHHFGLLSSKPEESRQMLVTLGYDVSEPVDDPLQNVRLYWGSHSTLPCVEIISPTDTPGPVSGLAKRLHQGIYHLCFEVSDVPACLERFSAHSRVVLVSPAKPAMLFRNRQVSFYFVENFGLIELLERDEVD